MDIGGVLLTDGWGRDYRKLASRAFDLDELEERHHQAFDAYEEGKLSLDEYLHLAVFHQNRTFTIRFRPEPHFARGPPGGPIHVFEPGQIPVKQVFKIDRRPDRNSEPN